MNFLSLILLLLIPVNLISTLHIEIINAELHSLGERYGDRTIDLTDLIAPFRERENLGFIRGCIKCPESFIFAYPGSRLSVYLSVFQGVNILENYEFILAENDYLHYTLVPDDESENWDFAGKFLIRPKNYLVELCRRIYPVGYVEHAAPYREAFKTIITGLGRFFPSNDSNHEKED